MTTPSDPHAEHVRKTIDHVLAQREEILAAFIAKHGFHPDQAIQIEQRQADGSTTWRIEKRPAPVPVSERLPGPEDCDAELYCWRWNTIGGLWARQPLARSWYEFESHWLPATALPLPQGGGGVMACPAIGHAVMRVIAWDGVEVHGVPMQSPPDGPQRFIQVFDTEEQAVAFSINEVGMTTPNRPPLWEVMSDACADHPRGVVDLHSAAVAAEIRALRDWLGHCAPISWEARVVICRVLTTEADRAERGEQSIGQEH